MFGFSFPKIILLLIIIVLVWNFFKFLEKISKKNNTVENKRFYETDQEKDEEALVECNKCGSFYSIKLEKKCPTCLKK